MLCDPLLSDIMIWMPCGQAWKILNSGVLFEEVIAQSIYFTSSTPFGNRYRSFMRQLSYWGFTKIKSGRNIGCYFNKLFKRDSPHLLFEMKRGPNRSSKKETGNNTPKQEAGKQTVSQNVSGSSLDGVTTQTADNGQAFSSSANLKRNPCKMRKSIPNVFNHPAAPVIYEQQKESNEGTSKERYSRLVNQEHVHEKLDVVKPSGPEREKEMEEKETHQQEEQKQTTQIEMTSDFISSSNSGTSSPSSNSDILTIYQLFKELQKQKEGEQEAQKALSSMTTRDSDLSFRTNHKTLGEKVPVFGSIISHSSNSDEPIDRDSNIMEDDNSTVFSADTQPLSDVESSEKHDCEHKDEIQENIEENHYEMVRNISCRINQQCRRNEIEEELRQKRRELEKATISYLYKSS